MMNTTIQIRKTTYPKSDFRSAGNAFNSTITRAGFNQSLETGLHRDGILADEIDAAMKRLIESMIHNGQTGAVVTVKLPAGYTLTAALKQFYIDKYTLEKDLIANLAFA
ncbi:hypothetical protein [Bacillus massilinigeriensis]|uniref:hypothetical protein n=1 Tax=Bacillus mediterraneensis TaxID=1805474 RepID=UPI00114D4278|nr:hypothetical protein [Bacillus mediterraneensis]